ncbi:MAG TPA: HAMP domain-containing sensor histidine kinase [Candidatus Thermoplasmatota archaeon]
MRHLNEFKTQLINSAAHELSTPLTPIRLQLHMLKSGERGALTDPQRWSIEVVDRNVERLSSLVKDLLDVARLDAARFPVDMRPTELAGIVQEASESFREPVERAGLKFASSVGPGLIVLADSRRLVQVLFSLIGNAIKFTRPPGSIKVEAQASGSEVTVSVQDTGVGFRPEDRERLFTAFSQIFNPDIGYAAGAGLGLYISKSIVELHGGRIWAHSDGPGKGSRFSFTVPLAAQGDAAQTIVKAAKVSAVVDDSFTRRLRELV